MTNALLIEWSKQHKYMTMAAVLHPLSCMLCSDSLKFMCLCVFSGMMKISISVTYNDDDRQHFPPFLFKKGLKWLVSRGFRFSLHCTVWFKLAWCSRAPPSSYLLNENRRANAQPSSLIFGSKSERWMLWGDMHRRRWFVSTPLAIEEDAILWKFRWQFYWFTRSSSIDAFYWSIRASKAVLNSVNDVVFVLRKSFYIQQRENKMEWNWTDINPYPTRS